MERFLRPCLNVIKGFPTLRPITGHCGLIKVGSSTTRVYDEKSIGGYIINARSLVSSSPACLVMRLPSVLFMRVFSTVFLIPLGLGMAVFFAGHRGTEKNKGEKEKSEREKKNGERKRKRDGISFESFGGGLWEKRNCNWEELSREIPVRIRLSSGVRSCA